jgi:hypothetical protein
MRYGLAGSEAGASVSSSVGEVPTSAKGNAPWEQNLYSKRSRKIFNQLRSRSDIYGSRELIIGHSVGTAAVSKFTYAAPTELVAFKGIDFYKDCAPTERAATH